MPAVGPIAAIHSSKLRMPVIISTENRGLWLDPAAPLPLVQEMFTTEAGMASLEYLTGHPVTRKLYARGVDSNVPGTLSPLRSGIAALDSLAFP